MVEIPPHHESKPHNSLKRWPSCLPWELNLITADGSYMCEHAQGWLGIEQLLRDTHSGLFGGFQDL